MLMIRPPRSLGLARNTVRRVLRSEATSVTYRRDKQPRRKLGAWAEKLEQHLAANEKLARRERLTRAFYSDFAPTLD